MKCRENAFEALHTEGVTGSIPVASTILFRDLANRVGSAPRIHPSNSNVFPISGRGALSQDRARTFAYAAAHEP